MGSRTKDNKSNFASQQTNIGRVLDDQPRLPAAEAKL